MRLRQRTRQALGADWVQPRASGRWTALGNLDSPWRGTVDPAGLVSLAGAGWSLDWWVGAEDRWHLPCREVAVRQSLVGGSPVVETRLRVPGGDAVHRAYAARTQRGDEALVVEVENRSTAPFAVALAVRPHGQDAPGRVAEIALDGASVRIDGRLAIVLPSVPGRVAVSDAARGDCATAVLAGGAERVGTAAVSCREGRASAALLFPLAHTAGLRVVLPLAAPAAGAAPHPSAFPSAAQVAAGWRTHAAEGARIEVPDRRLRDAVAASARHLLLGQEGAPVASALDLLGFPAEAARLLVADPALVARSAAPGASLHAVARHWELTRDAAFARAAAALVAALVPRLARSGDAADRALGARALAPAASLLEAGGEDQAAHDLRALAERQALGRRAVDAPAGAGLAELLAGASSTWTWAGPAGGHDLAVNAALVALVRDLLVREDPTGLALSPVVPDAWLGQGWELHDAPTGHGALSYAVRWHGDRPALLWQLDARAGEPVTLTAPGLDPTWRTTAPHGEALLAPVALPERAPRRGITIPVTIEPMPGRRP